MLRLAHISDLHFAYLSWNPLQIFSKRWLGNLNFALNRRSAFDHQERLPALLDLFKKRGITHVLISGDVSITSHPEEFKRANAFVSELQRAGHETFVVPGNHDHYTRHAYNKKLFYSYFPSQFDKHSKWNLKEHCITSICLQPRLWLVTLDTATPTSLLSSQGYFSEKMEFHLNELLELIPKSDQIILLNHFPFFQNDRVKNRLLRGDALRKVIERHPNILFYLHGHTHRQVIADLRENQLPIVSDPGSTLQRTRGGCHLIGINEEKIQVEVFSWEDQWQCAKQHEFIR
jgi:3',5'-cyclic AMP phosphodiesterase CpdA